jgi:hypothetical protein
MESDRIAFSWIRLISPLNIAGARGKTMKFSLKAVFASAATAVLAFSVSAHADVFISANSAAIGNGPIVTFDYTTGTQIGSFVPDGAQGGANGRGLAVTNNEFFYTELANGFGATDSIHIAPFNGGAGGHDIGSFANPAPGTGIQDLAFGAKGLYALTGYPNGPSVIYLLNPTTGAVISSTPLATAGSADGFTVLNDGTFIANLADGANTNLYQHFDASGNPIGATFSVPCGGCSQSTGVDIAPDGLSLYYATAFNSFTQTDLNNNLLSSISTGSNQFEDIGIQQNFTPPPPGVPEPATWAMMLLGVGAIGSTMRMARRKDAAALSIV